MKKLFKIAFPFAVTPSYGAIATTPAQQAANLASLNAGIAAINSAPAGTPAGAFAGNGQYASSFNNAVSTGSFSPTVMGQQNQPTTPNPTVSNNINAGQIATTKPLTITPNTPLSDINQYVNSLVTEQSAPDQQTPTEKNRASLQGTLETLFTKEGTKSDRFTSLNNQFNVPGMVNQLNDLNLQIAQRKNFFTQQSQTAEGKAIPTPFIVGEQTQIQRQSAIELGALASVAQAIQGNINLANDTIDRTLKMEFEPVENEINRTKTLLDLNYQDLSREDKKRADLTSNLLEKQQKQVDELKSAKKDAYTAVLNSSVDTSQKSQASLDIARATTPDEAYKVALKYGAPKADTQVVDIGGNKVIIDTKTGNTVKVLGASGSAPVDYGGANKTLSDAFNSATAGVPGTQLPTMQKTFKNLVDSGDVEGAKDYVIRVAMANAPVDQQTQAIGRRQAVAALSDIKSLLTQAKAKGADTGILSGNVQKAYQGLGKSGDEDLALIGNQIQQAIQTYRKAMSGVAFTPAESKEYKAIYPDLTNGDSLNTVKIDSLLDSFDRNNRAVLSFYIGNTNYDKLYGKDSAPILPSDKTNNPFAQSLGGSSITGSAPIYDSTSKTFIIPQ